MPLSYFKELKISQFLGLNTEITDLRELGIYQKNGEYAIYSPESLNWVTLPNNRGIELRRGTALLGSTRATGVGKITGLGVGNRFDGGQVPFFTAGRKAYYYDATTDDRIEIGTNLLPVAADGEEVSIYAYQNLGGAFVYLSSANSGIYKIPTANPGSAVSQSMTTYRGFLKFGQSRAFLYNRHGATPGNVDKLGLYVSVVDKVDLSQYPAQTTSENIGTGNGVIKTFTGTLANITGVRTAMYVTATDGTETFTDDRNGTLVGSLGGTGTINYATGAISVTFNTAPAGSQAITANYYYEDATSEGVCDFAIADPANRAAGEGNYFPQFDGGGNLNSVFPLATVFYCFHEIKTWQVSIPVDDESGTDSVAVNLPFREKMGVKSHYGAFGGAQAIYFLNTADPNKPEFMRLELYTGATSANIANPKVLSENIDFSSYNFDNAVVFEWGDYVILCGAQVRQGVADTYNSRMFIYNKNNKTWDLMDYPASRLAEYLGTLIAGDSVSDNVFTLFSGFTDDDDLIANYYTTGDLDLNINGLKRFTRFAVEGLIVGSQNYDIEMSFDGGDFITVATVEGDGSYVNTGKSIAVGSQTLGSKIVGGGETVYANPYEVIFNIQSPKFEYVRVRFKATSGGYVSINNFAFHDIRQKGLRKLTIKNA